MAENSKDIQLRELKDMISQLNSMVQTLQKTLDDMRKQNEATEQALKNAQEENAYLRQKLFGASSEKRTVDVPGQYNLFNEVEAEKDDALCEDLFDDSVFL